MKTRFFLQVIALSATVGGWIFGFGGCGTTQLNPQGPLPALPPPYVQVPHPAGFAMSDLRAIFTDPKVPKSTELAVCDADYRKLKGLTQAKEELVQGYRELVRRDPVKYHWCFYNKILQLEEDLKAEAYLDERQKKVLDTYGFLTPVGRAFMQEYHDSRYMRWAVKHYRGISEWVFYRKVEMTPQATSELVEASNPFGLLRDPSATSPVLEKYNIATPTPASQPATAPVVNAATASAPVTAMPDAATPAQGTPVQPAAAAVSTQGMPADLMPPTTPGTPQTVAAPEPVLPALNPAADQAKAPVQPPLNPKDPAKVTPATSQPDSTPPETAQRAPATIDP